MQKIKDFFNLLKIKIRTGINKDFVNFKVVLTLFLILLLMISIVETNDNKQEIKETNESVFVQEIIEEEEIKENNNHVYLSMDGEGYNVYAPLSGSSGYRYGPSIIYYEDGTMDAYFSSNANNIEWDWISYRHFDGESWGREKIVLEPSGDTYDHFSTCDPGVVYFNDYYYLGYTSTIVDVGGGVNNNVFVARSKNPDGPFEKWNGNGWGGIPKPIIYYDELENSYGAGEVSFVIKEDRLYCYYSWICPHGNETRVSIADLSENWPSTLQYGAKCFEHGTGQDSVDVVYVEEIDKFLAFSTIFRFTEQSGVCVYESDTGIKFNLASIVRENVSMHCHNLGISKRVDGHVSLDDNLLVGYAYSSSSTLRGVWATRLQNIKLEKYEGNLDVFEDEASPIKRYSTNSGYSNAYMVAISAENKSLTTSLNNNITVKPIYYDFYRGKHVLNDEIEYSYDEEYIDIVGNTIIPKKAGKIVVDMSYNGFYSYFTVLILPEKYEGDNHPEVVVFKPVDEKITIQLDNDHDKQLRSYIEFEEGSWGEIYNEDSSKYLCYKNEIDPSYIKIRYESRNPKIASVSEYGMIEGHKKGNTSIKVEITGGMSYVIDVYVR